MTKHEAEKVAKRTTSDRKHIILWSDGLVTSSLGWGIKGIGHSRRASEQAKDLEAGWLAMGDVELYDYAEVGDLVKAARKAVRQHRQMPLVFMREYFAKKRR